MKQRFLELAQTSGQDIANSVFSDVSLAQRQLWLASLR